MSNKLRDMKAKIETKIARVPLDPAFLALLACPACDNRPPLSLSEAADQLRCAACGRVYPISPEGIPMLVMEEAEAPAPAAS